MHPERAVERYLQERKPEVSTSTYRNHKYTLNRFEEWCAETELEDVAELDGFHVHDFKIHRRENADIQETTLRNNMVALRTFVRWLESMGVVSGEVADKILIPNPDDDTRDTKIEPETARDILEYLEKFEYATLRHAAFTLLWDTGFRLGTIRALDLDDYHSEEQYVEVQHRPETGTPLKNKQNAEREVNLHQWVCDVLDDYVQMNREDVRDEGERKPLLTTQYGRPAGTNLRQNINVLTRPCHYSGECPHGRDMNACEARSYNKAQRGARRLCPPTHYAGASSRSG